MYKSPIDVMIADIQHQIAQQQDEEIYKAVVSVGINVDKDELLRALQYDRQQYDKGYADGHRDAMESIVGEGNTWGDGFKQGYEDGFKVGFNADKWIPVTERLPEDYKRVLICGAYKFLAVGRVMNGHWVVSWNNDEAKSVTHWMPLPPAPTTCHMTSEQQTRGE